MMSKIDLKTEIATVVHLIIVYIILEHNAVNNTSSLKDAEKAMIITNHTPSQIKHVLHIHKQRCHASPRQVKHINFDVTYALGVCIDALDPNQGCRFEIIEVCF